LHTDQPVFLYECNLLKRHTSDLTLESLLAMAGIEIPNITEIAYYAFVDNKRQLRNYSNITI
jgi:hypothetical protein